MKTLPSWILTLALVIPLAAGSQACSDEDEPTTRGAVAPVSVSVETAARQVVDDLFRASGVVEPWQRASPGTKILGRVSAITVDVADAVSAQEVLARLEDADLVAAVDQARAAVAMTEARLIRARAQYERMRTLVERGSATVKNVEDATSEFRFAEASLMQAQANLAAAEATLGYAQVRSPIGGRIVEKRIEIGDMARPGEPFFVIENLARVKVRVQVPETDIVGVGEGDSVSVDLAALGRSIEARVDRVLPAGDPVTRTFDVEIHLQNEDGAIRSGMFARVTFSNRQREALMVSESALVERGQLVGVYVVEDDRARLRWIRVGDVADGRVEVLSGLEPGEQLVAAIPQGLVDGARVEVVP